MKSIYFSVLFLAIILIVSCASPDPNLDSTGTDEFESLEIDHKINFSKMNYQDTIYVPIYSDIYIDEQNQKTLLAATLSIRNTSYNDSLFVSKIDYFNTEGVLVRSYIKHAIGLPPMGTVDYVIEKDDDTGGRGANFIVCLSAEEYLNPLVQAVMIGKFSNKSFAFSTDGYSVKTGFDIAW